MLKAGIIDPTKVVRLALQDAASVAALLVNGGGESRRRRPRRRCRMAAVWATWTYKTPNSIRDVGAAHAALFSLGLNRSPNLC
jgi:hypothetical protein